MCKYVCMVIGGLTFAFVVYIWVSASEYSHQNGPSFDLRSVSVSSLNFSSNIDSQQKLASEFFLEFDVKDHDYGDDSQLAYQSVYVSVNCSTGTWTTEGVAPPLDYGKDAKEYAWGTKYMTATVRVPLPSFNATYVELPFDVRVRAVIKYKNWLHIHPKKHKNGVTNAICKGVRIGFDSLKMRGTLVGRLNRCLDG